MTDGRAILNLLSDRPIAYHPDIARIVGGVKAAVFLCQLLYWTGKEKRTDGFIWKTQEEMEQETALTRHEQNSARKKLAALGILEQKRAGIPAKLHYRINTDRLIELMNDFYSKQDIRKVDNNSTENQQTIPENTTENTPIISATAETISLDLQQPPQSKKKRKPKPRDNTLYHLARALAEVCVIDFNANKARIFAEAKRLAEATPTPTPDLLRQHYGRGGTWYRLDWRGRKNQTPTLSQPRSTWLQLTRPSLIVSVQAGLDAPSPVPQV